MRRRRKKLDGYARIFGRRAYGMGGRTLDLGEAESTPPPTDTVNEMQDSPMDLVVTHIVSARGSLGKALDRLRPAMATAAQAVLDAWQVDEEGLDEVYGAGGPCEDVAQALMDVLSSIPGIEMREGGHEGDDHAWLIVWDETEAYAVDIPPGVYETGAGYSWQKLPDVQVQPTDIYIEPIDLDLAREARPNTLRELTTDAPSAPLDDATRWSESYPDGVHMGRAPRLCEVQSLVNLFKQASQAVYLGQCDRLRRNYECGEKFWYDMMMNAEPITFDEFIAHVDPSMILDEGEEFEDFINDIPTAKAFKSVVDGAPVWFLDLEGFEVIFGASNLMDDWKRRVAADHQPWVAVDLDGTVLSYESGMAADGAYGEPIEGAREALGELQSLGWRVSIYTARIGDGTDEDALRRAEDIAEVLRGYDIPFDDVWVGRKPRADVFIDDRAVTFDGSWASVLEEVVADLPARPEEENGTVVEGLIDSQLDRQNWSQIVPSVRTDRAISRPRR